MVPLVNLPAEVCTHIVHCAHTGDLPALARVSKNLLPVAEARMYHHVTMKEPQSMYRICIALLARGSYKAQYVKRLWLYQDVRYCPRGPLPEELWTLVRDALTKMDNLESIYLCDDTYSNTWIFDISHIRFQLREAHLTFLWDDAFVSFLETQTQIRSLTLLAPEEDDTTRRVLTPGSLPHLESYDGPLFAALDVLFCPIKRMSIRVDEENAPLFSAYVVELAHRNKVLRSLNVHHVPEYLVAESLHVLAASPLAASLRYLGILALPMTERHEIHQTLLKFGRLEAIQVDLLHWTPQPMFCHLPMLATELRTYCCSIRSIVVWCNSQQFFGRYENDRWTFQQVPGPRSPSRDLQWREY